MNSRCSVCEIANIRCTAYPACSPEEQVLRDAARLALAEDLAEAVRGYLKPELAEGMGACWTCTTRTTGRSWPRSRLGTPGPPVGSVEQEVREWS